MKKSLLLATILLFAGCVEDEPVHPKVKQYNDGPEVFNVEHDGHKFIVFRQNYFQNSVAMFVIQHPDDGKVEKEGK